MTQSSRPLYAVLAVVCVISLGYRIRETWDRFELFFKPANHVRDPFHFDLPGSTLIGVESEAAAVGLKAGDVLLAVGGREFRGAVDVISILRVARPGDRMDVTVRSGHATKNVTIELKPYTELQIAREVQEKLFPQDLPHVNGFEYCGMCRPALGVGGDYYDFILLPDNHLGIAIGDVSGKGIPAALLMASLRASLRGQTIRGVTDLAALMSDLNRLVYESSSSNRYATFFYAQYDPETRILAYVNGGHNPPLIYRKSGEVLRLDAGGPVVGLLPGFAYEQTFVTLDAGDLLVAFTDGISEAMNSEQEEWGEDRLMECITSLRAQSSQEIMASLIRAVDAFVAGAKQHDDMTLIIARVS